jgi:hypothetical protein
VGERDLFGIGFSDNVIFRKQYYIRTLLSPNLALYLHTDEQFARPDFQPSEKERIEGVESGWEFEVGGSGFHARLRIEIDRVPEKGWPEPLRVG